jgi:hypothetical protein
MERDFDELAALEALDNGILTPLLFQIYRNWWNLGKTFNWARTIDVQFSISSVKYFAGWADKITGQSIEVNNWNPFFILSKAASRLDWWEKIGIHSSWTHRSRRPDHSMWVSLSLPHTSDSRLIQCHHQGMFPVRPLTIFPRC